MQSWAVFETPGPNISCCIYWSLISNYPLPLCCLLVLVWMDPAGYTFVLIHWWQRGIIDGSLNRHVVLV
jgi:hypothetical protein